MEWTLFEECSPNDFEDTQLSEAYHQFNVEIVEVTKDFDTSFSQTCTNDRRSYQSNNENEHLGNRNDEPMNVFFNVKEVIKLLFSRGTESDSISY